MKKKTIALRPMADKPTDEEKAALELVKRLGYKLSKSGQYVKFSSMVHEKTLATFRALTDKLDYKIQEALTEALDCWIDAKSGKK